MFLFRKPCLISGGVNLRSNSSFHSGFGPHVISKRWNLRLISASLIVALSSMNSAFAAELFMVDSANRVVTYETPRTLVYTDFYRDFKGLNWDKVSKFVVNASDVRALGGWLFPRLDLPSAVLEININSSEERDSDAVFFDNSRTYLHAKEINITTNASNSSGIVMVTGDKADATAEKLSISHQGSGNIFGVKVFPGTKESADGGGRRLSFTTSEVKMLTGGSAFSFGFDPYQLREDLFGISNEKLNEELRGPLFDISASLGNSSIVLGQEQSKIKATNRSYGIRALAHALVNTNNLSIISFVPDSVGLSAEALKDNDEVLKWNTGAVTAKINVAGDVQIEMKEEGSLALHAGNNGLLNINEANSARNIFLQGDILAEDGGKITLNARSSMSRLISNIQTSNGGVVNLGLGDGASWSVKGNSHVTTLTASGDGSHVYLTHENDKRNTLVIDELKGDSQITFVLHTDLSGKGTTNANDKVIIKSADSGSHALYIPSTGEAENGAESSYLVYAPDSVNVQLNEKYHANQLVDKGLYLYKLTSEKVSAPEEAASLTREEAPSYNGYYLTVAKDNPNDSGDTENPGNSGKPVTPLLSPTAKAVLAMAGMGGQNAMYHNQLSDLRKRLGEVRGMTESNGLWVSASGQRDRFDGFASNGVKQNAYRFNLGLDHKIGSWLVGANFKYLHGTQKTSNPDSHAKGKVNSAGANIYGTWIAENGFYTDIVASFDHYHQKITTSMLDGRGVSGKVNNFGLGLSAEVGKKFGLTKDFFVEPQAQLAYYWIKGKDFSMSNGMKVEQDDFNSLVGRLGVVAGKDFKDAEGNTKGQVFVKGGVKQQFAGKQKLRANSVQFKDELKGTSGYYGLGFEANPNKKVSLYGHVERENGKHYTKEIEVMLGLRYKF